MKIKAKVKLEETKASNRMLLDRLSSFANLKKDYLQKLKTEKEETETRGRGAELDGHLR